MQPSPPAPQPAEHPAPPPDFRNCQLPTARATGPWFRLNSASYPSALHFGKKGSGRFDGPNQSYGALYIGADPFVAFIETFGRSLKPQTARFRGIAATDLGKKKLFEIHASEPLVIVQLAGRGLNQIGADARLSSGNYAMARQWAEAIHNHPDCVDGLQYHSRLDNDRYNFCLFDRAKPKLTECDRGTLLENPAQLAEILDFYQYALL